MDEEESIDPSDATLAIDSDDMSDDEEACSVPPFADPQETAKTLTTIKKSIVRGDMFLSYHSERCGIEMEPSCMPKREKRRSLCKDFLLVM